MEKQDSISKQDVVGKRNYEVTPGEVAKMQKEGEAFVLLDCRTLGEWEVVRLEGAKLLPMGEMGGRMQELEGYREKKMVVYCHHGVRSMRVVMMLRQAGFEDVYSMAGGIDRWAMEVEPGMKRY